MKYLKLSAIACMAIFTMSACHSSKKATGKLNVQSLYTSLKNALPMAVVSRNGDTVRVVYPELAMFDINKADLKESAKPSFQRFATVVKKYPMLGYKINGFTDNTGGADLNKDLSDRRAMTGKNILLANGLEGQYMTIQGMGEKNPIMPNSTEEGRKANRRVEFLLYDRQ